MTQLTGKQDGDVAVVALWGGNTSRVGRATQRVYDRTGNGKLAYVAPEDAQAAPEWYRIATDDEVKAVEEKQARQLEKLSQSRRQSRAFTPDVSATQNAPRKTDFSTMSYEGLKDLAGKLNLEVTGTGKDGNTLKADYVAALEAHEAENPPAS